MSDIYSAAADFKKARDRAAFEKLISRITGQSSELLSYEDVRQKVRASGVVSTKLIDVPLDAIIGSVNRYNDFSRTFLPRQDSDRERWTKVYKASAGLSGLPPVDLYQIGNTYYVQDGHHRVSVAKQMGAASIQAYVTEIRSNVPLDPSIQPDDLILKAEYADFLQQTNLDAKFPEADFTVTGPGQYQQLLEHITVHQYYMGLEQNREIPFEEAVISWYTAVYLPIVEIIRDLGILHDFTDRTETDMYLWLGKHRAEREDELGWEIPKEIALDDLVETYGSSTQSVFGRLGQSLLNLVIPSDAEDVRLLSQAYKLKQKTETEDRLIADILIPLTENDITWQALEQALGIATLEGSTLKGLSVTVNAKADSSISDELRDRFYWRCAELGVEASFVIEVGDVNEAICKRARWTDLVAVGLANPPADRARSRLTSGIRKLLQNCGRPILFVPGTRKISKVLLAFNGSPKALQALYIAAYVAGNWNSNLDVVHVPTNQDSSESILDQASHYLADNGVEAVFHSLAGEADEIIVDTAKRLNSDLTIIGGYRAQPLVEVIRGSVVDSILRMSDIPTLVCG